MNPVTNERLIAVWDDGAARNPLGRALTILSCAHPERTAGEIAALSIPQRDLELLEIRRMIFGDGLRGYLPCAACGTGLEFDTQVSALLSRLEEVQPAAEATWEAGNFQFTLRPATSSDLAAALAESGPVAAHRTLMRLCTTITRTVPDSDEPEPVDWESGRAATEKFEELHRGAEISIALLCPRCGLNQKSELDIAQFLWLEIRAATRVLLQEVHELARAYGWSEGAILEMSAARRGAYLEMVHA